MFLLLGEGRQLTSHHLSWDVWVAGVTGVAAMKILMYFFLAYVSIL